MSTTSTAAWQRIYHTSLFRFTHEGREEVLRNFRESPLIKSANCIYDGDQNHFEISCMSTESADAELLLTRIVAALVQEDEIQTAEVTNYPRKTIKVSHATLDGGESFDNNDSDPDANFKDDNLIDLSTDPEQTFWTLSAPALRLDQCYPQSLLDAIGSRTACMLSLDSANRRIIIKPASSVANTASAQRRLANIEMTNVRQALATHSLKVSKPQDVVMHIHKLHEKAEPDAAFNEDGTLSRLLFPPDSSVFKIPNEMESKVAEKLPIKIKPHPVKRQQCKPASAIFSKMKFRKLGPDAPQLVPKSAQESTKTLSTPSDNAVVDNWVTDVVNSQSKAPHQDSQIPAAHATKREQQKKHKERARNIAGPARTSTIPPSTPNAMPTPGQAWKGAQTFDMRSKPPPSNQNVFATATYTNAKAPARSSRNTPAGPAKSAWTKDPRSQNHNQKQKVVQDWPTAGADQYSAPKKKVKPNAEQRRAQKSKPADSKQPARPFPAAKSLASNNPFAQLGDEDNNGEDSTHDEIDEQLADDDVQPQRLRVNRHRAPAPGPKQQLGQSVKNVPQGTPNISATESSDPSVDTVATNATSVGFVDDMPPFSGMLLTMENEDKELRLASGWLRDASTAIYSGLERGRPLQGTLEIRSQLGKVVMRHVPGDSRKEINIKNFGTKLEQIPGMNTLDQTFTTSLTTSVTDVDFLLSTLGIDESTQAIHQGAYFELTCIGSDKSSICLVIDSLATEEEPLESFARSSETFLGAWYSHHPQRIWDSRMVVTSRMNYPLANIDHAEAFVDNLTIRPDPELLGPSIAGRNGGGLDANQIRFYTVARFPVVSGWDADQDTYIEVKRVIDYFPISVFQPNDPTATKGRFSASCLPESKAIGEQQLWYEISLGLAHPSPKLRLKDPHVHILDPAKPKPDAAELEELAKRPGTPEPYEKAEWTPEEVVGKEQLLALHEVAAKGVDRIDNVGALNKGYAAPRERELKEKREKALKAEDQFW